MSEAPPQTSSWRHELIHAQFLALWCIKWRMLARALPSQTHDNDDCDAAQVLTGRPPFAGHESYTVPGMIKQGQRPETPALTPEVLERGGEELQELMQQCWAPDPCDRPTTKKVRRLRVEHTQCVLTFNTSATR
jgi:Protein tyrosine and serine/threonine kinase